MQKRATRERFGTRNDTFLPDPLNGKFGIRNLPVVGFVISFLLRELTEKQVEPSVHNTNSFDIVKHWFSCFEEDLKDRERNNQTNSSLIQIQWVLKFQMRSEFGWLMVFCFRHRKTGKTRWLLA